MIRTPTSRRTGDLEARVVRDAVERYRRRLEEIGVTRDGLPVEPWPEKIDPVQDAR